MTAVAKHFDVFEQIGLRVLMRPVARSVNPFVLQAVEEAFCWGVVPTISLAAHPAAHAIGCQLPLRLMARVLATTIRMAQRAWGGTAAKPCHRQRVRHEISRHARLDRSAHHFPIEQIEHRGQVQPTLVGPDVRDVRTEHLIGRGGRELAIQQIWRNRRLVLRVRRHTIAALVSARMPFSRISRSTRA